MKNMIIIGGSSGIGLSLVQKLTERGENVRCFSKSPCPVAGAQSRIVDVRDADALVSAMTAVKNIDALVYCAGVSLASAVEHADEQLIEDLIDVNLTCAILSCSAALKNMASGGRIVLLSSSGGVAPIPFDAPYSASKAGLIKFAQALDLELRGKGVTCTAAVIGGTRTRFSFKRAISDPEDQGKYGDSLKRATDALIKIEQTGYTADFVADRIIKIIDGKAPPPVVTIGAKNKLETTVYRMLPRNLKKLVLRYVYKI